jgi:hypothetical protein
MRFGLRGPEQVLAAHLQTEARCCNLGPSGECFAISSFQLFSSPRLHLVRPLRHSFLLLIVLT